MSVVCSLWACIQDDLVDEFSGPSGPLVALKPSQYIFSYHSLLSHPTGEILCLLRVFRKIEVKYFSAF